MRPWRCDEQPVTSGEGFTQSVLGQRGEEDAGCGMSKDPETFKFRKPGRQDWSFFKWLALSGMGDTECVCVGGGGDWVEVGLKGLNGVRFGRSSMIIMP